MTKYVFFVYLKSKISTLSHPRKKLDLSTVISLIIAFKRTGVVSAYRVVSVTLLT